MAWTAAVFLFYTVFGFFLLPPIVRVIAVKQLSKHLDRPVTIQKVRLNPYRFSATIRGLLIKDKDGAPLVAWDEADVNFQLASLFSPCLGFQGGQPVTAVRARASEQGLHAELLGHSRQAFADCSIEVH